MKKIRALAIAGAAAAVIATTGAIAVAQSSSPSARLNPVVDLPEGATPEQREVAERLRDDAPISVVGQDGKPAGFVLNSAIVARDDRVLAKLIDGFREPKPPQDEEYDQLFEALRVLDPVEVVDEQDKVVGYWTQSFMSVETHERSVEGAQTMVDEKLSK